MDYDKTLMFEGHEVRPEVLNYDDIVKMAPIFKGHSKLVARIFHLLKLDKVNDVHERYYTSPGIPFSHALIEKEFKIRMRVNHEEILARFPEGPFITVSNHPFGALDGIMLLHLVGTFRTDYKLMVNLFLNHISAMRPSFIPVDPSGSSDPEKKLATLKGIREAMKWVKEGHPMGFFPAGAVSKVNSRLRIRDRQWQPSIIKLIGQLKVPVVPIFFHGRNSTFFNILGIIDWRLRTLRLPYEVFRRAGKEIFVSIGEPISVERQQSCSSVEQLSALLRESTYALAKEK